MIIIIYYLLFISIVCMDGVGYIYIYVEYVEKGRSKREREREVSLSTCLLTCLLTLALGALGWKNLRLRFIRGETGPEGGGK